jgi:hypothetical protein
MQFTQFRFALFCGALAALALFGTRQVSAKGEGADAGFLFDEFPLTLEPGERTEAAGPFYYCEQKESEEYTLAVPPLFSDYKNPGVEHSEFDLLYPLLTDEHYGKEWRWQFFELFSFAGGKEPDENETHRFTLFPIYFQQRSADTNLDYTAVFPIYGHLKNRLFRDSIYFVMFPAYSETRKKDIVTDNYFYPFVHVRNGDGLHGWQVWPFAGREHKVLTTQTNGFGDVTVIGGHEHSFVLWPFWLAADENLGTANPETNRASLPFFAYTRSPLRDSTTVFWPFFSWIDERGRKYHEWEGPWPFVIFTRGEGKTTDRVWPIFSQSHNDRQESDSYVWPVYRHKRYHVAAFDEQRTTVMFYLYVGLTLTNNETGWVQKRRDMWPFFIWRRAFDGSTRLQVLAPLEEILVDNRGIERNWSPLWSVWRSAHNAKTGASSESLLWNLYRREAWPGDTVEGDTVYHKADHKKISLLFGLFRYERDGGHSETRIFYIPAFHSNK